MPMFNTLNFTSTRAWRSSLPVGCTEAEFPMHLDPEEQRMHVMAHRRRQHDQWVRSHLEGSRMDHPSSRAKACILVAEAARLERIHLEHQRTFALELIRERKAQRTAVDKQKRSASASSLSGLSVVSGASPARTKSTPDAATPTATTRNSECDSHCSAAASSTPNAPRCGCLQVPMRRLLTPRCRVISMLRGRIDGDVEETVDALRQTYSCDEEMLEDLEQRYGPEPEEVEPELLLASVEERKSTLQRRWARIGDAVHSEMKDSDAFSNVIRTLSVMRIFLEGSQNSEYGIDFGDRQRREAYQQGVLAELRQRGSLFL